MLIKRSDDLRAVCERARAHGRVAVDTEFHQEETYYARLALVQLGVDDRRPGEPLDDDDIFLIDPLDRDFDITPLADLMVDPAVEVVFHAAENDLVIIERFQDKPATNVFDTQVAAAMLGMGAQIGYGRLMEQVCGVSLAKQESFSNWLARPLRDAQLSYAQDDVRHLLVARDRLAQGIDERGRRDWLAEELQRLEDPARYNLDVSEAWRRVPGSRDLSGRAQIAIQALAAWREDLARSRNVPRQRVLGDKTVLEFARRPPANRNALLATRGLRRGFREADEVLAVLARAAEEAKGLPRQSRKRDRSWPPQPDKHVVSLVGSVLGALSQQANIDSSLLANRREVEALVCWHGDPEFDPTNHRLLTGWRAELVGNNLLDFLEGRVSVQLDAETGQPHFAEVGPVKAGSTSR